MCYRYKKLKCRTTGKETDKRSTIMQLLLLLPKTNEAMTKWWLKLTCICLVLQPLEVMNMAKRSMRR